MNYKKPDLFGYGLSAEERKKERALAAKNEEERKKEERLDLLEKARTAFEIAQDAVSGKANVSNDALVPFAAAIFARMK